jgi:hypothetical protein
MKIIIRLALAAAAAGFVSVSQATPVTSGPKYMETIYHDCVKHAGVRNCIVTFTKIPAHKVLTVADVSCSISAANATSGYQSLLNAFLKVSNAGIVGTQVTLPVSYGNPTPASAVYTLHTQMFAIIVGGTAGYAPTITTQWNADIDGDMTCTISGELGAS